MEQHNDLGDMQVMPRSDEVVDVVRKRRYEAVRKIPAPSKGSGEVNPVLN
jgi:hypothetical protein